MKKALPVILLILGGILACGIGLMISGLLFIAALDSALDTEVLTAVILLLVIGGHVTGAVFLQRLYQRRWQIGKAVFWLCAGLPSALIGVISFAVVLILDKLNYFSGLFAGMGEYILALAILIYSGAFFVILGIVLMIIHAVSHKKRNSSHPGSDRV
ncbi:MAG: hypothetical protein J6B57_10110 [Oscillospiraceae bacterium]|nr:hypothetical protein [Oscillospiraceae bacterium]